MKTFIKEPLPQTSDDEAGKNEFESYLKRLGIKVNSSDAVVHYQATDTKDFEVNDESLNFCLEVEAEGVQGSCAVNGKDAYGIYSDYDFDVLRNALLAEFESCYQFDSESTVYKGISLNKPYYKKFDPETCSVGDVIRVNTFFSTTVSRDKAENFGSIVLKLTGLDTVECIVPPVAIIPGTGSLTHEQEVLIKPKFLAKVVDISDDEMHLELQAQQSI